MPKPFFIARPSGLFVRFLVPADLRAAIGGRFFVRRLYCPDADTARLAAAHMGAALSDGFKRLRQGEGVDIDEALRCLQRGQYRELKIGKVVAPDGSELHDVEATSPEDFAYIDSFRAGGRDKSRPMMSGGKIAPVPEPQADGPKLSQAIADYLQDRSDKRDGRSELSVKGALDIFFEVNGDMPLSSINRGHMRNFEEAVLHWPANARKLQQFKGMTAPRIVRAAKRLEADRTPLPRLADRTRQKYRDIMAGFFNYLVDTDELSKSPTRNALRQLEHRIQPAQTRRPYSRAELDRIFDPATFGPWSANKPHHYWAPWLLLYSAARLNEVSQLYCDDVDHPQGIPGFHVRLGRSDQHIKTGSSMRFIPLAQTILDAGFLDYVADVKAAGHARLFPHLKYTNYDYGDYLGDSFGKYLVDIGLKAGEDAPEEIKKTTRGMGVHWFRNNASTDLLDKGATPITAGSITAHGASNFLPGSLPTYVDLPSLPKRLEAVNSFVFPIPPKYEAGHFAGALKDAHRLPAKWKRDNEARARRKDKAG